MLSMILDATEELIPSLDVEVQTELLAELAENRAVQHRLYARAERVEGGAFSMVQEGSGDE